MTVAELVAAVRKHAVDNYTSDGWDYVVECWEDDDIAAIVRNCRTVAGAIRRIKREVAPIAERRDEVRAEAM